MGWHGKSSAMKSGGHISVDFYLLGGSHYLMHHIYQWMVHIVKGQKGRSKVFIGCHGVSIVNC
jgi:hypothetical protein